MTQRQDHRPRTHLHEIGEIAAMLNAQADILAPQLLHGGGRRAASEWVAKDFSGAPGTELSICIHGAKKGVWAQFNASGRDSRGDMLDLVRAARCGGNQIEAIKWAKAWLGLDGADKTALERNRQAVALQTRPARAPDDKAKTEAAYRLYRACAPIIGTLAEAYLHGRGIDFSRPLLAGRLQHLLFHPALATGPRQPDGSEPPRFPAMIAPVFGSNGKFMAVHRTWLAPRDDGSIGKAPIETPKKVLGRTRGGFIPLWRGMVMDETTGELKAAPPLRDAPPGQWIDLTEGIEDGGSVVMHCPEARVFVGISLSNIAAIKWRANVEGINFWRQNDKPGGQAEAAADRAIRAMLDQGKRVRTPRPPAEFKDVNDWLRGVRQAGQQEAAG